MFDEQPDGDPHGECAAEIKRLEAENAQLRAALSAPVVPALVNAIYALRHADDWIGQVEHDDNCFVTDEPPGAGCHCGKDGVQDAIMLALEGFSEAMGLHGEPLELALAAPPKPLSGVPVEVGEPSLPKSMTAHFSALYLLSNCRRIADSKRAKLPNWALAMELFAVGSTTASRICVEAGLDPEATTTKLLAAATQHKDKT